MSKIHYYFSICDNIQKNTYLSFYLLFKIIVRQDSSELKMSVVIVAKSFFIFFIHLVTLCNYIFLLKSVGSAGFEPAVSSARGWYHTKLDYDPIILLLLFKNVFNFKPSICLCFPILKQFLNLKFIQLYLLLLYNPELIFH
jgi:hypothetical protein